ncbi:MAG: gliding motility protein GldN [Chitinophagales bacterium]|nr:gliding motility protein GldN [Chitinophagaceae bacterium]MBP9881778.1 gliding motility protein GldN [Chitinophagales bacterium]
MKQLKLVLVLVVILSTAAVRASGQADETMPRDLFYDKIAPTEKEVIPYDNVREADVLWQKRIWRIIDSREKMNLPFKYEGIDWKDLKPLIFVLRDAAVSGEITVYQEDNFKVVKLPADVAKIGAGNDTIPLTDLDGNYIKDTVLVREFDPTRVSKYRIKEDWFFDEETSTMQVRIIAIAPLYYDDQIQLDLPMFWAHYPTARNVLVKQEVFNPRNDAVRLTWDDLFEMRLFSSYIYKESNVFDRRIQDYLTGTDALRESDRIKQDIFEYEHDVWSY